MIQHNFDMEDDDFNFSTHFSPYLEEKQEPDPEPEPEPDPEPDPDPESEPEPEPEKPDQISDRAEFRHGG